MSLKKTRSPAASQRLTVYLPTKIQQRIRAAAKAEKRTVSGQVEIIISDWLSADASHRAALRVQAQTN